MEESNARKAVNDFLEMSYAKAAELLEQYPKQIPVPVAAELIGCDQNGLRAAVENGQLGLVWRKVGKANKGYAIPTAKFLTWWLNINVIN